MKGRCGMKSLISWFLISAGILWCCRCGQADDATRIVFPEGQNYVRISRTIRDVLRFTLPAQKGQGLVIGVSSAGDVCRVTVNAPNGKLLTTMQSIGEAMTLPEDGDYAVTVIKETKNPPETDFTLEITLMGKARAGQDGTLDRTGQYSSPQGNLDILDRKDGSVRFRLVAYWKDHFGELCGEIKIENNAGTYKKDQCEIRFEFFKDHIDVNQVSLDTYCDFGANVTATGTYRKEGSTPDFSLCP